MKKAVLMISCIALLFMGCVKGDTGATGPAGTNGTNGINGTNGTNGNANVHSGLVTLSGSNWGYNSSGWNYYANVTDVDITSDVVNYGTVEVFGQNGTYWASCPTTVYYTNTQSYTYTYNYGLGQVNIFINMSDASTFITNPSVTFKVVTISGSLRKAHPNTNWKNYNEVMAVLNEKNASAQ